MSEFDIKFVTPEKKIFEETGVEKSFLQGAIKQHSFRTLKISNLTCAQANILKQTAISCGTDCSVHRETITGRIGQTDCILSGSLREFEKINEKLLHQPLKLKILAQEISEIIFEKVKPIKIRNTNFDWSKPYIMGILNVTPDSFSDGGCYLEINSAFNRAKELIEYGADIVDIGGESARPYAEPVSPEEEISRILPVIRCIRAAYPDIPLSIDTRNSKTAFAALKSGIDIVNDVSAGEWDEDMFEVCAKNKAVVILSHSQGTPENMQDNPVYENCTDEIIDYLKNRANAAFATGIENIIIDPGIGFGKTVEQNLEIIKNTEAFLSLKLPLLVGHSRKNFLKQSLLTERINELDEATAVLSSYLAMKGTNILRVHNVKAHQAIRLFDRL